MDRGSGVVCRYFGAWEGIREDGVGWSWCSGQLGQREGGGLGRPVARRAERPVSWAEAQGGRGGFFLLFLSFVFYLFFSFYLFFPVLL